MSMKDEYIMLRGEIDDIIKYMHQYFMLACGGIFAALAYIFKNPDSTNNPNIFIAAFAALVCIASRVRVFSNGMTRISTYMEIFLEPNIDGRKWETISHYRINNNRGADKKNFFMNNLFFRSNSAYLILGILAYILYLNILEWKFVISTATIFNTIALCILAYMSLFNRYNKVRDKYISGWNTIKAHVKEQI